MKVLLVNGSPSKEGCTYTALKEVADTLNKEGIDTEIFWVGAKPVGGCMDCEYCRTHGECVLKDVVNEFQKKLADADGFVFGSPVHYAAASGNLTSFMDRLFFSTPKTDGKKALLYMKPAAAVVSARRGGNTATFDQINKYFTIQQMPVVSSCYWNMVHGNTPDEVRQDKEGLYTMRVLGRNMAYLLRCMEAASKAGVPLPETEPAVYTNFIH